MHERHLGAVRDVEPAGADERGGREHRHDGHAVHVVGDGFARRGQDVEAAPAFAFGRLEALEEVEEGEGGCRGRGRGRGGGCCCCCCWWVGCVGGDCGEDCLGLLVMGRR